MKKRQVSFSFCHSLEYRAVKEHVSQFLQVVLKADYKMMEIAINEAVNNALEFGKQGENCRLRMAVINDRRLVVRVHQGGLGFSANTYLACLRHKRKPGWSADGCGLFIMAAVADYLRYNRQGTEVIMVKKIL